MIGDDNPATKKIELGNLGISGEWNVRNLWSHEDEGVVSENLTAEIPAHGCKIMRLSRRA